jgi:hypothetical protein
MALISIPSSIGGVTIPGTSTNGPLGVLFNNPFSQTNLQYPRDLQSSARGHYVTFLIKDINPIGYQSGTEYTIGGALENVTQKASYGLTNTLTELFGDSNNTAASAETLTPESFTNRGSISLYIPETMAFQYGASYSDVSLTSIAGKAIGAAIDVVKKIIPEAKSQTGKAITSIPDVVSADAAKVALRAAGLALNPKLQLLFESIGFRTYQMSFTFTPYSQSEAEAVKKIISTFKQYAAPRIVKGNTGGMFFIPPAVFEPKFYFNGTENKNVNAVTQSVITNIDVNYAPNGWATFGDGAPVQTTLTLQFKETAILDRDTLITGNY